MEWKGLARCSVSWCLRVTMAAIGNAVANQRRKKGKVDDVTKALEEADIDCDKKVSTRARN